MRISDTHVAKHSGCCLYEAVRQDVIRELVISNFHRKWDIKPASDLLRDGDSPANGMQGLLLGTIAVEKTATERPPGGRDKGGHEGFQKRLRFAKRELPLVKLKCADCVRREEEHAARHPALVG